MKILLKNVSIIGAPMAAMVVLVLFFSSASYAGPIYSLNNTIGAGGVTGTIETDATIGTLLSSNILDWNLVIDDGSSTFNLLGPLSGNNSALFISAVTSFSATATNLLFDFSTFTGGVLFQNPNIGSSQNWYAFEDQADGIGGVAGSENLRVGFGTTQSSLRNGVAVIATIVPEPSTLTLATLALLGMSYRRRKRA